MFRKSSDIISIIIAAAVLVIFLWSAYSVVVLNRADIYAENGLLENIQAIVLLSAGIVFLASTVFEQRSDRLILVSCCFLCLAFLLREVDVEKLDVPDALKFIGAGVGRNSMLAVAFLGLVCYAAWWFSYYKNLVVRFVRSKAGLLLITAGILLVIAELFEKHEAIKYHVYIEEMLELVAYACILLAAFVGLGQQHRHFHAAPSYPAIR